MHSARLQTMILDTQETDRMDDEHPTIYHISQIKKKAYTTNHKTDIRRRRRRPPEPDENRKCLCKSFQTKIQPLVTHDESTQSILDAIHPAPRQHRSHQTNRP